MGEVGWSDERALVVRLHRRAGFGLAGGELAAALDRGLAADRARLVEPDAQGVPAAPDPFAGLAPSTDRGGARREIVTLAGAWVDAMVASPRPLVERMAWLWHGHFVSSLAKVKVPALMAQQVNLFRTAGLGSLAGLVRAVTVDPAMLAYLDGGSSTRAAPNENYSRELLELFTLGRGNYAEADVAAGAVALTGWRVSRGDTQARFVPRRHDDTLQTYLGREGVHDVDTIVAAVTGHPACAPFVAGVVANELLGPQVSAAAVARLAARFTDTGLDLGALAADAVDALVAGEDGGPVVLAPVPWLVAALRATGARLEPRRSLALLRAAGQVPLAPPNVGAWPGGRAWFGSGTVVARFDLAGAIAAAAPPDGPVASAARAGDPAALADALGLPGPFGAATAAAFADVADPASRIVLALTAPEFVLA